MDAPLDIAVAAVALALCVGGLALSAWSLRGETRRAPNDEERIARLAAAGRHVNLDNVLSRR